MTKLIIEAERKGYSTDQIERTMTVAELIEKLEEYEGDTPVYLSHDNGYTFGGLQNYNFSEEECEDEEMDIE